MDYPSHCKKLPIESYPEHCELAEALIEKVDNLRLHLQFATSMGETAKIHEFTFRLQQCTNLLLRLTYSDGVNHAVIKLAGIDPKP